MNLSPSPHREVVLDLPDPPRISMPKTARIGASSARQTEPLSLEQELTATRSLRERCERLLVELGCAVDDDTTNLQGSAA